MDSTTVPFQLLNILHAEVYKSMLKKCLKYRAGKRRLWAVIFAITFKWNKEVSRCVQVSKGSYHFDVPINIFGIPPQKN